MKKLFIIGSALVAFTAVNYIANNNSNTYTNSGLASVDTVPKKDTTKKDSLYAGSNTVVLASLDTVPKKDTTKKDSIAFAYNNKASFIASLDTVPKKDTAKKDSLFLAMR